MLVRRARTNAATNVKLMEQIREDAGFYKMPCGI